MGPDTARRKLEPLFDGSGRILYWKCSNCSWKKVPDHPEQRQATLNTIRTFAEHKCESDECLSDWAHLSELTASLYDYSYRLSGTQGR